MSYCVANRAAEFSFTETSLFTSTSGTDVIDCSHLIFEIPVSWLTGNGDLLAFKFDLTKYARNDVTKISHWHHGISNHWQLNYLFQSLSRLTTKKPSKLCITGPSFIKPDQLDPWIKDQPRNALLSTILSLQLPNFVSCGRACPSHRTKNLVTVGTKFVTGE